jgi:plasmid stabilization system protein ParE
MRSFVLTHKAEEGLDAIDEYVAERFGNAVAERVTERLFESFARLAEQPGIGTPRLQWTSEDVLFWPVPGTPALVVYRDTTPLEVLRVWNGTQDPRKIEGNLSE